MQVYAVSGGRQDFLISSFSLFVSFESIFSVSRAWASPKLGVDEGAY